MFSYFTFTDKQNQIQPRIFENPIAVVSAQRLEEVIPAMERVQQYVSKGYYAAGYLSYEAGPAFDDSLSAAEDYKMPLVYFGIYQDFTLRKWQPIKVEPPQLKWEPDKSQQAYHADIAAIKDAISRGDTYQTNYTMRLRTPFSENPEGLFHSMQQAQSADFAAYLRFDDYAIASASPELFFRWDGQNIVTRPMKGTIKRGRTFEEDERNRNALAASEKDRAENVMIVDLLRNDISRVAELGTVSVPKLYSIEKYPTVYQMTSEITAKTKPDTTILDVMRALFPCGSITGAPKASTMKLIHELEQSPREVYCGAIGYIEPGGEAVFNVPIRTAICDLSNQEAVYSAGGGITWDSTAVGEYKEALAKAQVLHEKTPDFELLETIRYQDGCFELEEFHLRRILQSAAYFSIPLSAEQLDETLNQHRLRFPSAAHRFRLTVSKIGEIQTTWTELDQSASGVKTAVFAKSPIDPNNRFLYHKTTHRTQYQDPALQNEAIFDVILWNNKEEITEFTIGNLVLEKGGSCYTPPVSSGLLPGTLRQKLLEDGIIQEKVLFKKDVQEASAVWLINSVRGWVKIKLREI